MIARMRVLLELFSRFMGRLLLTVLYFTIVLPFGIIARLRASARMAPAVAWKAKEERAGNLTEARKQF
jgi:hypothetical protein